MTADLVRAAQRGDHAAFEKLIAAAYDRLYAVAYRILRGREAAEDASGGTGVFFPVHCVLAASQVNRRLAHADRARRTR